MTTPIETTLLVIGNDDRLIYLLQRFAEQSGCQMIQRTFAPWIDEMRRLKPVAIIFLSMELLQAAQSLVEDLSTRETLVLVCTSLGDEIRARESGADACLFHPLTYDDFRIALSTICPPESN